MLADLVGERANRRHRPGRGFEALRYRFEIVSDYGAFRDLQRHRMLTVQWQALTPDLGAAVPDEVVDAGCGDLYRARARALARGVRPARAAPATPRRRPYALCLGYRIRYVLDMNAREAMHLIELRSGREGHPGYRAVAHEMHALIAERHPAVAAAMTHVDRDAEPRLERILAEMRPSASRAALAGAERARPPSGAAAAPRTRARARRAPGRPRARAAARGAAARRGQRRPRRVAGGAQRAQVAPRRRRRGRAGARAGAASCRGRRAPGAPQRGLELDDRALERVVRARAPAAARPAPRRARRAAARRRAAATAAAPRSRAAPPSSVAVPPPPRSWLNSSSREPAARRSRRRAAGRVGVARRVAPRRRPARPGRRARRSASAPGVVGGVGSSVTQP